jgi:hypothetical protein
VTFAQVRCVTSDDQAACQELLAALGDTPRTVLARAAASTVAQRVQAAGQIPVWGAGHDNEASLHIARTLGFTEVARRTFVIPNPDAP